VLISYRIEKAPYTQQALTDKKSRVNWRLTGCLWGATGWSGRMPLRRVSYRSCMASARADDSGRGC